MLLKTNLKYLLIFIVFLICVFSFNANYSDNLVAETVSQEDLSFYEINPCKVSLIEFLIANPKSLYQNHYKFIPYENSSIECFGRISGLTKINNYEFYISVGLNGIINLLVQSLFWALVLRLFIKNKNDLTNIVNRKIIIISNVLTSSLVTMLISTESRFYEGTLNLIDVSSIRAKIYFFIIFFVVINYFQDYLINNVPHLLNYAPILFLISFIYQGFNLSLIVIFLIFYGFVYLFDEKKFAYLVFPVVYISIYIFSFKSGENYYFEPDKLRGFSGLIYSVDNILLFSIKLFFIILGLVYIFNKSKYNFNLLNFINNLCLTSIAILTLGIIGSQIPIINFFNLYIFGHNKRGTTENNLFLFDTYSNKVAWRGLYPSAETIGEFFGITLLFIIFYFIKNKKITYLMTFGTLASLFGMYLSNNRSAIMLVLIFLIFFISKFIRINKKVVYSIFLIFLGCFLYFYISNYIGYSYQYTSKILIEKAVSYSYGDYSSSLNYLQAKLFEEGIASLFIGLFSSIAFYINRSELWGIFLARYEVDLIEFLFGTGPFNLSRHYGLTKIQSVEGLLLPHSSFLSILVFFGLIGLTLIVIFIIYFVIIKRQHISNFEICLIFYLLINLIKSDSILYHQPLLFYTSLYYLAINNLLNFKTNFDNNIKYLNE